MQKGVIINKWVLTDSGHVASGKLILGEAQKDTGLADRGVADDYQFYKVIVLFFASARVVHF